MEYILVPSLILIIILSAMVICYLILMVQRLKKDRDCLQEQFTSTPIPVIKVSEYKPDTLRFSKAIPKEVVDSVTPEKLYDMLTTDFIYSSKETLMKYIYIYPETNSDIIPNHILYDMEIKILRKT